MSFILSNEREARPGAVVQAFEAYRRYLAANQARFPVGAYGLASSDWYFNANDHRSPHDGWLESLALEERGAGARQEIRSCSIRIVLLGAYHDCRIELIYPKVHSYRLGNRDAGSGAGNWRYDEFRLTDDGHVIHEIEWASGPEPGGSWLIEASDVQFKVLPTSSA